MEINTSNIDEAKIVTENNGNESVNVSDSLQKRINRLTERKEPTAQPAKPENKKQSSGYWDVQDDDFEKPKQKAEPEKSKETKEKTAPETTDKKITDRAKEGSARTAVGMVELTQGMILKPWVNYKFKNKFTAEDIEKLGDKVAEAEKSTLTGADLTLRNKWDKLMDKRDKLMDRVPLNTSEKKDLTEAFYNYFDITEKNMPPEWYLAFAIINSTGNRIIDIAFD